MAIDQQSGTGPVPGREHRPEQQTRRRAWLVLSLLFLLLVVNYADKVIVGLAGVDMMKEIGIGADEFGVIQSSFFWLFAIGAILGGWLGGKVKARWLLAGIAALWAVSMAPMVGQVGFTTVVVCRVLLGFAEGPTTALVMHVTHTWFPPDKRAVPSSLVASGAAIGPVIAAPALTWVITQHSWHAAFGVMSVVGVIIVILWLIVGREGPESASDTKGTGAAEPVSRLPERVPLLKLFGTGTFIGFQLLFFVAYMLTATVVSWLPLYLRDGHGYDATTTGNLVALLFLGTAIAAIASGFASSAMTKRGMSNRASRGYLAGAMVLLAGIGTVSFPALDRGVMHMVLITLAACASAAGYGVSFTGLSDIVPAKQRGTVFGVVTGVYSLGGIVAPILMGALVESADTPLAGYKQGFIAIGAAIAVGAAIATLLINPERDGAKLAATS
ncbi:MFS transporter [Streptomyces albipurpureus]|uniref:MFS transporter n=1 Tax=Streptomyces albipurpureus TaxID=2897419 RepID=A0ABT0UZ90_9ACTN|nr:MFS transporter [Streptomyces sp. CWNU-1]MCM2393892.1 MFS transporter [Streptomyces sp. CWNU-1]